jgi:hypothetical protein
VVIRGDAIIDRLLNGFNSALSNNNAIQQQILCRNSLLGFFEINFEKTSNAIADCGCK